MKLLRLSQVHPIRSCLDVLCNMPLSNRCWLIVVYMMIQIQVTLEWSLALRAGDITNLDLIDVEWSDARIRFAGKDKR